MFVGEGDQTEVVWESINISDENVEIIASQTDEILRQGKSKKETKKSNQVKYVTRSRVRLPEVSIKNKSVLECPNNCGSSFFYKHTLDKHIRFICGQPLRYKCPYCDLASRIRYSLNVHIKSRHPNCKNYVIDTFIGKIEPPFEEDFNTPQEQNVQPTWNEEHEIKILSVSSLAKPEEIKPEFEDFKADSNVKSPPKKTRKKFVCPNKCGSSYKYECSLKAHMEFACGQVPRFKCPYCDHRSSYQHNIIAHTKAIHLGTESYAIDMLTDKEYNFSKEHQSDENQIAEQEDSEKNQAVNSFHVDDDDLNNSMEYDNPAMNVSNADSPEELLNPMAIGDFSNLMTSRGKYICPNSCGGTFSSRSNLKSHMQFSCGKPAKFECPYCAHRIKQPSNGFTHIRNHHPGSRICLIDVETGEIVKRKKDEQVNMSTETHEVQVTRRSSLSKTENNCQHCGKDFKYDHTLSRHIAEGCGQPPRFKCPYCEYQVRRLSYAFSHVTKNHPGSDVYMVDLKTGENITDSSQIKKELLEEMDEVEKPLAPNPAYVSRTRKVLKSHPFGLKKKKLICPKGCGQYFFFKLSLQKHLKYTCKKNLNRHKRVESTKFKCPYCCSTSAHRSSILRHIKSHHPKSRRYVIDTKAETVSTNNESAVLNRSEVKKKLPKQSNDNQNTQSIENTEDVKDSGTFHCPNKCGSSFEHSFNINRHLRDNCSKVRRFKCPNCNYCSQKFRLVTKHIKANHRLCKIYAIDVFTKQHIYKEPKRRPRSLMKLKKHKTETKKLEDAKSTAPGELNTNKTTSQTPARKGKNQNRFPCPNNCGSFFHSERYIDTHLRLICGQPARFKCPYCQQICRHQGNMTIHIKHRHPGRRNYMIDIFKRKAAKEGKKKQKKQKISPENLEEEVEQEVLTDPSGSNDVVEQNTTNDVPSASDVQPHFMSIPDKKRRYKSLKLKRRIDCPHNCGRTFNSLHKMKIHAKSLCKMAPIFKCPYCTKICKHSWNIGMHIKYRHPESFGNSNQLETVQVQSEGHQKNELENHNKTEEELMNMTEDDAGHSSKTGIEFPEKVNDLGLSNHVEAAGENMEVEENIEVEDANEADNMEVDNVEIDAVETEGSLEPNAKIAQNTSNLTNTTSSKRFFCPNNCGSSYSNQNSLKTHVRLQCGQSPRFKCPYCDNCSKQTSNGYAHVKKIHPARQIYLIDVVTNKFICGSRYQPSKEVLEDAANQDIVRIQDIEAMDDSNDEPDEPDEPILGTEEEFGTPGPATSQKALSEQNKPFSCPNNCGSSFNNECNLTRHVRDQCGPPRYKCPYCFYITRQPSNVYAHIKKKHPDERIYMIDTDMNQSCDEPGSPPGDHDN